MQHDTFCADRWANEWKHPNYDKWLLPLPENYVDIIGEVETISDISDWYYNPNKQI
jgi:hypothetical protein